MKTSPRPKARPAGLGIKPKANPMNDRNSKRSIEQRTLREMAMGGKTKKMAMGGKCRGMGAASKGGNYKA